MGNCSSSWAIAAVSSMTDRLCIAQNERLELSVQQLLSCDQKFGKGCNGGALDMVWNYMKEEGLVSSTCFPYKESSGFFKEAAPALRLTPFRVLSSATRSPSGSAPRVVSALQSRSVERYSSTALWWPPLCFGMTS
ncbi:unnamed protein product [Durusdinium trenchii]|uniref:Peptidase C1A papain C-terminal domain-containing protein n=1 Tax=Durusdinium trenchii TaxID=1381693 RepID=A0ABP0LN89_9DINO